jgi:penicillin-binding protein 1A
MASRPKLQLSQMLARSLFGFFLALLGLALLSTVVLGFAAFVAYPNLPSLETLTDYQPKIPLRIHSAEGNLIGEFGEERRALVKIGDVPERMRQAILAAEDERFYEHGGIDYLGVMRAAYSNFTAGSARQGASTITMQVARNFFLSKEKTFTRKFNEVLLAFKIEHNLSKDQILELYVNQIYLGQHAYGFVAAAQAYFGKNLEELTLAETAVLAGLPKAPSRYNPVANPGRAKLRQQYVLRRMHELDFISHDEFSQSLDARLIVKKQQQEFDAPAAYFAEMVRQAMYDRFKEEAYTKGYRVFTTLSTEHQKMAQAALHKGLLEYDRRHGFRGAERYVNLAAQVSNEVLEDMLQEETPSGDISPAIVLEASPKSVKLYRRGGERLEISGDGLKFASPMLGEKAPADKRLKRGAVTRVHKRDKGWEIVQLPAAEAALISISPDTGAIFSLVGGFDYDRNKFNHVSQAWRQPGSSFKPFIYSAALEKGFTPATIVNDAPLSFAASQTGSEPWEPKNYDGIYGGPMRIRTALAKSKNLVTVRIMQAIGPQYAQDYITRFGFDARQHPAYLTMALGAGSVTPLQMAVAYSVFANGGYRVTPYVIERIEDSQGRVLAQYQPERAGTGAPRVIDERNAYVMTSLMRDVVKHGTAARAMQLGRNDLAGKTGTTNDQVDAWFAGFNRDLVAVAWIGFDNPHSLGEKETGAQAALPIWMGYVGAALKGVAERPLQVPQGIAAVSIDPETGLRVPRGTVEYFYQEHVPPASEIVEIQGAGRPAEEIRNQIF